MNRAKQDTATVKAFVDSFEDDFAFAERVFIANPDLRDDMIRAVSRAMGAGFTVKS